MVLIPPTTSRTNVSESSEKNKVHFDERVPYSCQSNTLTTENTWLQLSEQESLQITPTKQNEDSKSSVLLLDTQDKAATCQDLVLTALAKCDPLTNSSINEVPSMIDKMYSDFSQNKQSHSEETPTATQIKPSSETKEVNIQESVSELSFSIDDIKNVECLVPQQCNVGVSELAALLNSPKMDYVPTEKDGATDNVSVDSSAHSGDSLESEEDKYKTCSQDCDVFVSDGVDVYVSNVDASKTVILTQHTKVDESRSEPDFDLLIEENKTYISEEKPHLDIVVHRGASQCGNFPSEIVSQVHFPKIEDQTKQKEDLIEHFEHLTVSEDLDLTVEYPEDLNVLSNFVALENDPLNQDSTSKEPNSELGNDQPFPAEHHGSGNEEDQPVGVLISSTQIDTIADDFTFMVSWPKMDNSQKKQKESQSSIDSEESSEVSADVFEKNDNKPFEDSTNSQDLDVPVSATADETDMLLASSKASPEAVSSRFFGFEELLPTTIDRPIKDDEPRAGSKCSDESEEVFEIRALFHSDQTLSPSQNEYCIPPGYDEVSTTFDYNPSHIKAASPTFELSDTEAYFDCKQGASDFSETESEETESKLHQQPCRYLKKQRNIQESLSPPEIEDYVDYPITYEPLYNVQEEIEDDSSDEEFTLCEAPPKSSVCETGTRNSGGDDDNDDDDDTNESISREIAAELGTLSESSDDDFLTTRIIRRRVFIKADEMTDFPPQSISEETYTDENGHTVVKKVTRRVIRKCASSSDGDALEQASSEAGAHSSIKTSKGDGYSRVVKRTVVKSEGDQSEVTFTECKSSLKQDNAEGGRAIRVEKRVVLEGERTMTHHGDESLASDVPPAQDDFKQALSYLITLHNSDLPCVGQRETVRDDGTLVKRAQMRKGHSVKQTVVKGGVRRKQVLSEQVEGSRIGSKSSDLKQHLHQLFHRNNKQDHREDTDAENTS